MQRCRGNPLCAGNTIYPANYVFEGSTTDRRARLYDLEPMNAAARSWSPSDGIGEGNPLGARAFYPGQTFTAFTAPISRQPSEPSFPRAVSGSPMRTPRSFTPALVGTRVVVLPGRHHRLFPEEPATRRSQQSQQASHQLQIWR
jgi:hypothetical protein